MPKKGLTIRRQLPFDEWLSLGERLADIYSSAAWCLGDWLIYGETAYSGRYREAIERTSLDYQTLRNYAWVARRYSLSRRLDTLSFAHHAEVAALSQPEQDFWLRKAEELAWSVKKLRQEVRDSLKGRADDERKAVRPPAEENAPARPAIEYKIRLLPDQLETCQAAAERSGLSIEEWTVLALEQAARSSLGQLELLHTVPGGRVLHQEGHGAAVALPSCPVNGTGREIGA